MIEILPSSVVYVISTLYQYAICVLPFALSFYQKRKCVEEGSIEQKTERRDGQCPYEYLLSVYGRHHFQNIVHYLAPNLQQDDRQLYDLVLEIMDTIHFGAILVDDVTDNSQLRKGRPSAHRLFGSSETVNRAYLVILRALTKCQAERPSLVPCILRALLEIHQGQDDSLVWRRDGFERFSDRNAALDRYRLCASMKTGALFRLVGQLITGSHELDALMSDYGWYCQLQNDCKNVFSAEVITAKGALAEDLVNGEYSFPILVGLYSTNDIRDPLSGVLACRQAGKRASGVEMDEAILALQHEKVRNICLAELENVRERNEQFAFLWGRSERMTLVKGHA